MTVGADGATRSRDIKGHESASFADLGRGDVRLPDGQSAAINHEFVNVTVEMPGETSSSAPRA